MPGPSTLPDAPLLRDLLAQARSIRSSGRLTELLTTICAAIGAATETTLVRVDVHRPQWNDFETVAAWGEPSVCETLIGGATQWSYWAPRLAPQFEHRGVQHVGPGGTAAAALDDGWSPSESLFAVLRRGNGDVIGMVRVAAPVGGRRPDDRRIDAMAMLSEVAALAIDGWHVARDGDALRAIIDGLADATTAPPDQHTVRGALRAVCETVQSTLGFGRAAVLVPEGTGVLQPAVTVGWDEADAAFSHPWLTASQLPVLLEEARRRHGCAVLARDELAGIVGRPLPLPPTTANGRGPYAWRDHVVLAPMTDEAGRRLGLLWADEPTDRLMPERERLQALRVVAGRAAALVLAERRQTPPTHDALTGLPSRATLADRLAHALGRERRSGSGVAVLFIDLDRFAAVNDAHGPDSGDAMLRAVARRIDGVLRPSDTVARFGGDEFVIVCEDVGGADQALAVAERLRLAISRPATIADRVLTVTCSVGVALPDQPARSADELLQAADRAMYDVKAAGRDGSRLAAPGSGW